AAFRPKPQAQSTKPRARAPSHSSSPKTSRSFEIELPTCCVRGDEFAQVVEHSRLHAATWQSYGACVAAPETLSIFARVSLVRFACGDLGVAQRLEPFLAGSFAARLESSDFGLVERVGVQSERPQCDSERDERLFKSHAMV